MKTFLTLLVLGSTLTAFPATHVCTYDYNKEGSTLAWTAFKTPKKVGVGAKFSDFTITTKKSASIDDLLKAASFSVNSQAIDSGDKARDAKIAQFFFKKMVSGTAITGKVLKASGNVASVEFSMNGKIKVVEMTSKFDEAASKLTLTGALDVLDFGMKDNLAVLTKACFEKHEGVTWPNVNVELVAMIKKSCN